jgi:thioredoxin-like negative regulator of GroEL
MGGPARVMFVLALAAAALPAAAATDRFVPADPDFVVANVRQSAPDAELRELIARWRESPVDTASIALAQTFLERAHSRREPMYVGRAESVLAAAAKRPDASIETRRLYAETLQYRHEFSAAEAILDGILGQAPADAAARTQRASVRLVRGDFAGARGDCAQLLATASNQSVALACLAESHAGSGRFEQARALLAAYPLDPGEDAAARAYFLAVRAELQERAQSIDRAIADYSAALTAMPREDSIRAALADALIARGDLEDADALLDIERPSLALVVRRVSCTTGARRERLRTLAAGWLDLEAARGDALHYREAAMLALAVGDGARALQSAERNFATQKELADVRVLARAAVAAGDQAARRKLADWMLATGFRDAFSENVLGIGRRG